MSAVWSLTETIDNAFLQTWYEIRAEAVDNILDATPVWNLLRAKGCFKPQVGGRYIERTIRYAVGPSTQAIAKGDTLGMGEVETETAALWTWRYLSVHIQRSMLDDQINNGKSKIKSYVSQRLKEAKDSLKQQYENDLLRAITTDESGKEIQGLNDLLPPQASYTTGTYGKIARPSAYTSGLPTGGNTWWGPKYKQLTAPYEINLEQDMRNLYNSIHNNQEPPDIILTTQTMFEIYEEFASDKVQIVKDESQRLADLGFEVLRFKGKPFTWSPDVTASNVMMLNSKYIDVVYDPQLYFVMTDWKPVPNQLERLAHIVCAMNIVGTQPRRHGRLYP